MYIHEKLEVTSIEGEWAKIVGALFHPHIFQKTTNNTTQTLLPNEPLKSITWEG